MLNERRKQRQELDRIYRIIRFRGSGPVKFASLLFFEKFNGLKVQGLIFCDRIGVKTILKEGWVHYG